MTASFRTMYDATSSNAEALVAQNPTMIAIYLTGTPDIRWTSTQVQLFPQVQTFVRIDQAGPTSPQFVADVFDVEPGAWKMADAVAATAKSTSERPTIYCDRNDYKTVPDSYKGCLWIAAPGLTTTECVAMADADPRIVAVQNVFAGGFDKSVVLDPNWPKKAPVPPPPPAPVKTAAQIEYYKDGFGWVFVPDSTINFPINSSKIRVRASNGNWCEWVEITPGDA